MTTNLETLELKIAANAESATKGVGKLISSLVTLQSKIAAPLSSLEELNKQLEKIAQFKGMKLPNVAAQTGANNVNPVNPANMVPQNSGTTNVGEQVVSGAAEKMEETADAASKLKDNLGGVKNAAKDTASGMDNFKKGLKSATSGISGLFSRIKRLATTMFLRSAIKSVVKDIKTTISNVYQWSKLNSGTFASSMDSAATKVQLLKNSIGASLTPILTAIIPIFNSIVSQLVNMVNYMNQFLSLITGQSSWIKATEQAEEYEDAANKAKNSTKDMLAAFDELNVVQSSSSGSSKKETDYATMFEQMTVYEESVKSFVNWLKENLNSLIGIVATIGAGLLAWKVADAFSGIISTLAGLVAIGAVVAITAQLSWMLTGQYLDTSDPTWLIAQVLTTAFGATAAGLMAKQILGGAAGSYAAAVTCLFSAAASITANIEHTDVSALSEESIATNAVAALEAGAGIGFIAAQSGAGFLGTLTAAAGGALIVFGVAMGLKTVFDSTNTEWDSQETIIGALTAAIPVGLGLFALGAGALTAAVAAIATFGVVLAIKAMMPKDKITYGDIELSEEQVQEFVDKKMFNVDVKTTVTTITDAVDTSKINRVKISEAMAAVLDDFKIIKLGIATNQDYEQMKTDVDTVVSTVDTYINSADQVAKRVLTYTPTLVGSDDVTQGTWYTNYNQGWDAIQKFVSDKGKQIGEWLTDQESKEIKDATPDVIQAAMDQLNSVTEAIKQAQTDADAFGKLQIGLGDLDEKSCKDVIDKFKEYKDELTGSYEELVSEQYKNQAALVEALLIVVGEDDPRYKQAVADLEEMGKNMSQAVTDGVNKASEQGTNMIYDWLDGQIGGCVETWDWADAFERNGIASGEDMVGALRQILESTLDDEQIELADLVGFTGWDLLSEEMKQQFMLALGDVDDTKAEWLKQAEIPATDVIQFSGFADLEEQERKQLVTSITKAYGSEEAIAALKEKIPNISVDGIIKMTDWESFSDDQKLEFVNALKDSFGAEEAKAAAEAAGIDIGDLVTKGMDSQDDNVKEIAKGWSDIIGKQDASMDVDIEQDETKNAKAVANDVSSQKPSISTKIVEDPKQSIAALKGTIDSTMGTAKALVEQDKVKNAAAVATDVANQKPSMNAVVQAAEGSTPQDLANNVSAQKPVMNATTAFEAGKGPVDVTNAALAGYTATVNADAKLKPGAAKAMSTEVSKTKVTMNVSTAWKTKNDQPATKAAQFGKQKPTFQVSSNYKKGNSASELSSGFGKQSPTFNVASKFKTGASPEEVVKQYNNQTATITIDAKFTTDIKAKARDEIAEGIKDGLSKYKWKFTGAGAGEWKIEAKALGGIVRSADIFMANENGRSELIGRIGNQTGVANQEQMVEAMARGVGYANAEQNALLREQNNLLMRILQKDGTVKIGASAALGRVAQQSIAMYGMQTGG